MEDKAKWEDLGLTYEQACHAMQSGVRLEMEKEGIDTSSPTGRFLKHLRVGVNSCLVEASVVPSILIEKGLITEQEYLEKLRLIMNQEVANFQRRISLLLGKDVKLG